MAPASRSNGQDLFPLPPTARRFAHLLSPLNRRLHVMPATLQLTQNALARHLSLEVLDRTLYPLVADCDFKRFALNRIARLRRAGGFRRFGGFGGFAEL